MAKDKTWLPMSMKRFVFFYQVAATFLYFQSKQNGVELPSTLSLRYTVWEHNMHIHYKLLIL